MERLVAPRGVPINILSRVYMGGIMQVGVLHKEEVSDDTKRIYCEHRTSYFTSVWKTIYTGVINGPTILALIK